MATEREELEATIADLERTLADAPPEMRGVSRGSRPPRAAPARAPHVVLAGGAITSQSWYHDGALHGWSKHREEDGFPIGATRHEHGVQAETVLPDGQRRALRS